jgi:hypothetical protein
MLTIVSWCQGGNCDPCKPSVPTPPPATTQCLLLSAQGYYSDNFTSNINVGQAVQNYIAAGNAQKVCNPSMIIQIATILFFADGSSVGGNGLVVKWPIYKNFYPGTPNPASIAGTFQMGFGAAGGAPGGNLAALSGSISGLIAPGDNYYTGELKSGIPGNTLVYTGLLPSNPNTYVVCKFYTGQIDAKPRLPLGATLYD